MNDVNSPANASGGSGCGGPLLARRYIVVGEIPSALAIGGGRGAGYWPLAQLVKDWNNQPESRALMLVGGLPEGTDATVAAKVAVVVHALCQRDSHPLPSWVLSADLTVAAPSATVLLAMKLYAARDWDLQDAVRLASDTHITDLDQMLALVVDAYGAAAATAEIDHFAQRALSLAREGHNRRRQPPDRGFSAGL